MNNNLLSLIILKDKIELNFVQLYFINFVTKSLVSAQGIEPATPFGVLLQ